MLLSIDFKSLEVVQNTDSLSETSFSYSEPKSSNRVGETRFQDHKELFRVGETTGLTYGNANRRGETRCLEKAR